MARRDEGFSDLGLFPVIVEQCNKLAITKPTPVQENCIPKILSGKNCIAVSQTGTGKTLAFALPLLQKLNENPYGIFALILTPTRELAAQIVDQIKAIGNPIDVEVCLIIGGMNQVKQGGALNDRPQIVVATPGRLADMFENGYAEFFNLIKFLVLDEADRLLNGQFHEQLDTIMMALPTKKQCLIFSATLSENVEEAIKIAKTDPFIWKDEAAIRTVEHLKQHYVKIHNDIILNANLVQLISFFQEAHQSSQMIIFTKNCDTCQIVSLGLKSLGIENVALNSHLKQRERMAAITKFKSNRSKILVATDLASRGLDIPAVDLVVNLSVPPVPTDYIHRVGRTARAGRGGFAITFVTPRQVQWLLNIEKEINCKLTEFEISEEKVLEIALQVEVAFRQAKVSLESDEYYERKQIHERKRQILEGATRPHPPSKKRRKQKKFKNESKKSQKSKS